MAHNGSGNGPGDKVTSTTKASSDKRPRNDSSSDNSPKYAGTTLPQSLFLNEDGTHKPIISRKKKQRKHAKDVFNDAHTDTSAASSISSPSNKHDGTSTSHPNDHADRGSPSQPPPAESLNISLIDQSDTSLLDPSLRADDIPQEEEDEEVDDERAIEIAFHHEEALEDFARLQYAPYLVDETGTL